MNIARSEFILGGQRSGKSRRAEQLALEWLAGSPDHRAVLIATGQGFDDEMRRRIDRHQADRTQRAPGLSTLEAPIEAADALRRASDLQTLVVVDCLTLWLTNLMMPIDPAQALDEAAVVASGDALCSAISESPGPVVLVGNEIGLGVIPMGADVRRFVDALGRLNQRVAAVSERVTLMAAGLPLGLKGGA